MEKQLISHTVETTPTDCREVIEWLAEAGVTVDMVETQPTSACTVCPPIKLHVAA